MSPARGPFGACCEGSLLWHARSKHCWRPLRGAPRKQWVQARTTGTASGPVRVRRESTLRKHHCKFC
eukprot:3478451-Alexandrium_andersonii.AAC.1